MLCNCWAHLPDGDMLLPGQLGDLTGPQLAGSAGVGRQHHLLRVHAGVALAEADLPPAADTG